MPPGREVDTSRLSYRAPGRPIQYMFRQSKCCLPRNYATTSQSVERLRFNSFIRPNQLRQWIADCADVPVIITLKNDPWLTMTNVDLTGFAPPVSEGDVVYNLQAVFTPPSLDRDSDIRVHYTVNIIALSPQGVETLPRCGALHDCLQLTGRHSAACLLVTSPEFDQHTAEYLQLAVSALQSTQVFDQGSSSTVVCAIEQSQLRSIVTKCVKSSQTSTAPPKGRIAPAETTAARDERKAVSMEALKETKTEALRHDHTEEPSHTKQEDSLSRAKEDDPPKQTKQFEECLVDVIYFGAEWGTVTDAARTVDFAGRSVERLVWCPTCGTNDQLKVLAQKAKANRSHSLVFAAGHPSLADRLFAIARRLIMVEAAQGYHQCRWRATWWMLDRPTHLQPGQLETEDGVALQYCSCEPASLEAMKASIRAWSTRSRIVRDGHVSVPLVATKYRPSDEVHVVLLVVTDVSAELSDSILRSAKAALSHAPATTEVIVAVLGSEMSQPVWERFLERVKAAIPKIGRTSDPLGRSKEAHRPIFIVNGKDTIACLAYIQRAHRVEWRGSLAVLSKDLAQDMQLVFDRLGVATVVEGSTDRTVTNVAHPGDEKDGRAAFDARVGKFIVTSGVIHRSPAQVLKSRAMQRGGVASELNSALYLQHAAVVHSDGIDRPHDPEQEVESDDSDGLVRLSTATTDDSDSPFSGLTLRFVQLSGKANSTWGKQHRHTIRDFGQKPKFDYEGNETTARHIWGKIWTKSRRYFAQIHLDPTKNAIQGSECTCQSAKGELLCRHVAALFFQWRKEEENFMNEAERMLEGVENVKGQSPHQELQPSVQKATTVVPAEDGVQGDDSECAPQSTMLLFRAAGAKEDPKVTNRPERKRARSSSPRTNTRNEEPSPANSRSGAASNRDDQANAVDFETLLRLRAL